MPALIPRRSYLEATARQRLAGIIDAGTWREILPPTDKVVSPHLGMFDAPVAFDDGVIVGEGQLDGRYVCAFAQEGKFRGGALGEVHASKIVGLLRRAAAMKPVAVLALVDSGGVRLEEANAGEIGASEIIRAVLDARRAGVPVIGLIGGSCGCFGGASLFTSCFDFLVASEEGRLSVSGPEVIETVMGVEAFDSRDRALVWRTTGGKNRYLFGTVHTLVEDHIPDFRQAAATLLGQRRELTSAALRERLGRLKDRIEKFGHCKDGHEVWHAMGLPEHEIPGMDVQELTAKYADRRPA